MDDLIQQGANAFKSGDRETARKLLISALKQSPNNERAWGWMYNVCNTDQERIQCLKQMLRINPENEKASALFNELITKSGPPIQTPINVSATKNIQPQTASLKKCPYCAEMIQEEAVVCRFCGRELTTPTKSSQLVTTQETTVPPKKSNMAGTLVLAIIAVCILSCILMWAIPQIQSNSSPPTATIRPEESAWSACTLFIQKQLGISFLDAQRYTPSGVTVLNDRQYSVIVYYAKLKSTYKCVILHRTDGDWQLVSLDVK